MPERNLVMSALVLRAKESPAGARIVSLMTAEAGLVDVFVFGGPKSKLRSLATPWSAGRAFVYHDPVKDLSKLSDFEVQEGFPGLREALRKIWAAGLVSEFLQRSSGGGGDYPEVLALALDCLAGLEALPEERADYPVLLFLWRMLAILGLQADPDSCASCGAALSCDAPVVHSSHAGGFLCPRCEEAEFQGEAAGAVELGTWRLTGGAHRWLSRSAGLPFAAVLEARLSPPSLDGLKALVFNLARHAAEGPLASLSSAAGIL